MAYAKRTEHKIWIVLGNLGHQIINKVTKITAVPRPRLSLHVLYQECFSPPFSSTSFRRGQREGEKDGTTLTEAPAMAKSHTQR